MGTAAGGTGADRPDAGGPGLRRGRTGCPDVPGSRAALARNLLVVVRLRGLNAIGPFEMLPAERFPMPEVKDRTVAPHSPKRMGRLLDTQGRATRRVPFDLPRP
ncbi:hypothetical protein GCM10010207_04810 [Streptomyces atratus]|nr:hypothetical protein GCM10010207_04810 [Streptomyces atratus]